MIHFNVERTKANEKEGEIPFFEVLLLGFSMETFCMKWMAAYGAKDKLTGPRYCLSIYYAHHQKRIVSTRPQWTPLCSSEKRSKAGWNPHHLPDKSSPETNGQHTGNIPNNRPATSSTTLSKNPKASSIQSLRIRIVPIWEWDWCRNELTMVPFPGITMKRKRNSNDNANQSRLNNQLV